MSNELPMSVTMLSIRRFLPDATLFRVDAVLDLAYKINVDREHQQELFKRLTERLRERPLQIAINDAMLSIEAALATAWEMPHG